MSLQEELGLSQPITHAGHEILLGIVLTGGILTKEGDRLLRPFGLTDSQFNVLMLLKYQGDKDGVSQTRLGEMLLVNRSNVTGLVDRMQDAGMVRRTAHEEDRRVKRIQLTPVGRRLTDKAEQAYFGRIETLMKHFSADETRTLRELLERLRRHAGAAG